MDINNDLQQINTFVKGMNTDVSDALMDSSQYRYAENVRLSTNTEENTGELRLIEGTSVYSDVSFYGKIIAMTSIRDLLVVITVYNDDIQNISYNYILVRDTSITDTTHSYYGWMPVFSSFIDGKTVFSNEVKLVTRWENSNDIKLYIADRDSGLTYINLAVYKNGTVLYGLDSIKSSDNILLSPMNASISSQGGSVYPAKTQYAYILYKEGGVSTQLSPLSNIVIIDSGYGGYATDVDVSDKAVDLSIPNMLVGSFTKMQIFRVSYKQVGQTPDVSLIYDGDFKWSYTDTGYDVLANVDYDSFLALMNDPIVPTVIESKGDYLFAANVKYLQDNADEMLPEDADLQILSSGDYANQDSSGSRLSYNELFNNVKLYNDIYWRRFSDNLIGGDGTYISWKLHVKYFIATRSSRSDSLRSSSYWEKHKCLSDNSVGGILNEQTNSLRQGEVYRYGAIFYTATGKKSSVKWLCDIMAPVLENVDGYEGFSSLVNSASQQDCNYKIPYIGIDFTINQLPEGFAAVEIVRCNRTINDKISLMQGIVGFPYEIDSRDTGKDVNDDTGWTGNTQLCAPYILSTNRFKFDPLHAHSHYNTGKGDSTNKYALIACPEYVYLPDDVKNILKSPSSISISPKRTLYKEAQYNLPTPLGDVDNELAYNEFGEDELKVGNYSSLINNAYSVSNLYQITRYSNYWDVRSYNGQTTWYFNLPAAFSSVYASNIAHMPNRGNESSSRTRYIYTHNTPNVCLYDIFYKISDIQPNTNNINIDEIGFVISPDTKNAGYNFLENGQINYLNNSTSCGGKAYYHWTIPFYYGILNQDAESFYKTYDGTGNHSKASNVVSVREAYTAWSPTGSTGNFILVLFSNGSIPFSEESSKIESVIVNIQKRNPNPYGGRDTVNTVNYISHGNYRYGTGTILVFDGDCYPGVFSFNVAHAWYDSKIVVFEGGKDFFNGVRCSSVCYAPIESDIDLFETTGDLYEKLEGDRKFYFQDYIANFDSFTQSKPAYLYNTAYSYQDGIAYSPSQKNSIQDNNYDTRIYYSGVKNNGESVDNWLHFQPLDYIDVDSRFGQVTNLRLFKDKLLFWQEHATGILSVNERTVLNDLESNDIIVGTGGVLLRYDYISTVYGMKPFQYEAEVQSNTTQYWWDGYNKEILAYGGAMDLMPMTKTKGLTNYINKKVESMHPTLLYDVKYDEMLSQVVTDKSREETLTYAEQIQAFSSIYTFNPWYKAAIGNTLYLTGRDLQTIYTYNSYLVDGYSLLFNKVAFPKVRIVVNKNNIYTKTFDNLTFGGRMYKGSLPTIVNWPMLRGNGEYIKEEHLNAPMHHLIFTFETPLKQKSSIRGDKATSVDEYDYRLAIPRNGSDVEYGNRMRGKTMQCEIASDYNSTDFSLQYITTKFRMSWS